MQIIRDVYTAVETLGGNKALAKQLGVGATAVANWKIRKRLPPERYVFLNRELAKLGFAIDIRLFPSMTE